MSLAHAPASSVQSAGPALACPAFPCTQHMFFHSKILLLERVRRVSACFPDMASGKALNSGISRLCRRVDGSVRTQAGAADARVRADLCKVAHGQDGLRRLRGQLPRGRQDERLHPVNRETKWSAKMYSLKHRAPCGSPRWLMRSKQWLVCRQASCRQSAGPVLGACGERTRACWCPLAGTWRRQSWMFCRCRTAPAR